MVSISHGFEAIFGRVAQLVVAGPRTAGNPQPGDHSFKNTLSAGDRNALALAFFFASVELAPTAAARSFNYEKTGDLLKEARHLRTACYIVTDLFSGIRDSEMMSLTENCISRDISKDGSTEIMWLHGTIYKTGGHWLKEWRASVRTAENKEALIAEYADTITLNGTGHSWCVGNAKGNGCGGFCVFEAQMCVDCNYGIIGPEHRPVWQGIYHQQLEALALDDMGPAGRTRAQKILQYAAKVLRRLDGEEAV